MFTRYEDNKAYLQNEFVNCPWDESTGMHPDDLEKQMNALWDVPLGLCAKRPYFQGWTAFVGSQSLHSLREMRAKLRSRRSDLLRSGRYS